MSHIGNVIKDMHTKQLRRTKWHILLAHRRHQEMMQGVTLPRSMAEEEAYRSMDSDDSDDENTKKRKREHLRKEITKLTTELEEEVEKQFQPAHTSATKRTAATAPTRSASVVSNFDFSASASSAAVAAPAKARAALISAATESFKLQASAATVPAKRTLAVSSDDDREEDIDYWLSRAFHNAYALEHHSKEEQITSLHSKIMNALKYMDEANSTVAVHLRKKPKRRAGATRKQVAQEIEENTAELNEYRAEWRLKPIAVDKQGQPYLEDFIQPHSVAAAAGTTYASPATHIRLR